MYEHDIEDTKRKATHIAVFAGVNISLTVPPATLKKAELKKPVRNLKIKKTSVSRGKHYER